VEQPSKTNIIGREIANNAQSAAKKAMQSMSGKTTAKSALSVVLPAVTCTKW